jgi:hypothetical protein
VTAKPKTCSVYPCGNPPAVALRGKPPHGPEKGVFWFCRHCAPAYERMGYEPLRQGVLL